MIFLFRHYPTTKHTQVADTPENRRIADNTKIQSNVSYCTYHIFSSYLPCHTLLPPLIK